MIEASLRKVVLVDADNLEIETQGEPRRRINYRALLSRLNGGAMMRAIYYRPERRFPDSHRATVERAGFEVVTTYKNSDAWFISDAVLFAPRYDVVVFVGGDGDLEPVIPIVKGFRVRVEAWSWNDVMSERVKALVDRFVPLDDLKIVMESNCRAQRKMPLLAAEG